MGTTTVAVTDQEFESKVLQSEVPVVVDFWAPWCGPCRTVAPLLEDLAGEYGSKLTIAKVNTDADGHWATHFKVMAIPTMIIFKGGKEIKRIVGARPKSALKQEFDAAL